MYDLEPLSGALAPERITNPNRGDEENTSMAGVVLGIPLTVPEAAHTHRHVFAAEPGAISRDKVDVVVELASHLPLQCRLRRTPYDSYAVLDAMFESPVLE